MIANLGKATVFENWEIFNSVIKQTFGWEKVYCLQLVQTRGTPFSAGNFSSVRVLRDDTSIDYKILLITTRAPGQVVRVWKVDVDVMAVFLRGFHSRNVMFVDEEESLMRRRMGRTVIE